MVAGGEAFVLLGRALCCVCHGSRASRRQSGAGWYQDMSQELPTGTGTGTEGAKRGRWFIGCSSPLVRLVRRPTDSQSCESATSSTVAVKMIHPSHHHPSHCLQVSLERFGAALCCGSCAVYRRAAVEPFGGVAAISHSEDMFTGFEMTRRGSFKVGGRLPRRKGGPWYGFPILVRCSELGVVS